jgi:ketosteroid isomerase-like protein
MSRDNVELVREALEAVNRGDRERGIDAFDPSLEWHDPPGMPGAGVHRGRQAVLARWREIEETLQEFRVEPEQYFDAGDRVVLFARSGGRGRLSGVEVSRPIAYVVTGRDRRITRVVGYEDRAAALDSVGLREENAQAS